MVRSDNQVNAKVLDAWFKSQESHLTRLYENHKDRRPKEYKSNAEALEAIKKQKANAQTKEQALTGKRLPGLGVVTDILIDTVAFTAIPSDDSGYNLGIYDYDAGVYRFTDDLLNEYVVALMGSSSDATLKNASMTIIGKKDRLVIYNPPPRYKIAVGNGIYNCLTRTLEPFTPYVTLVTKISTNYVANATAPMYRDGFTFEKMVTGFANGNELRERLIKQICKSIITGRNITDALFIILGQGGDGKSTFFQMLINLIGRENVGILNFSDISNPDKFLETLNKKLVVGLDNDVNLYISKTATLKSMASHESVSYTRKYKRAIQAPFTATVVQLCNEMPRFSETTTSIRRRLVSFKAENSHTLSGTENFNVEQYIKDRKFLEYVLFLILCEDYMPYYSNYNDVDMALANDVLDADDTIGQFLVDLEVCGVFTEVNQKIPVPHLYALYRDWMKKHDVDAKRLGSKGFAIKMTDRLKHYGYFISETNARVRASSLEDTNQYSSRTLLSVESGKELRDVLDTRGSALVRYFERRDNVVRKPQVVRRVDHEVTALEYFGYVNRLKMFADKNNLPFDTSMYKTDLVVSDAADKSKSGKESLDTFDPYHLMTVITNGDSLGFSQYYNTVMNLKGETMFDRLVVALERVNEKVQDGYISTQLISARYISDLHEIYDLLRDMYFDGSGDDK